jgi:hypothetical protein
VNVDLGTATHEAGHALVSAALGVRVLLVRALPLDAGVCGGHCSGLTFLDPQTAWGATPEVHASIDVAGGLAERLAGFEPRGNSRDLEKALGHAATKADPRAWLERIVQRTVRILNWNASSLCALVAAVSKRGDLGGEELGAILKTVARVEDGPQQTPPAPRLTARRPPALACPHPQPCDCVASAGRSASRKGRPDSIGGACRSTSERKALGGAGAGRGRPC